jgi:hypothetical protein
MVLLNAQRLCADASQIWINRFSTFSQGIQMSRTLTSGINYWLSESQYITQWWRKNLLHTAESLCATMSLAGSGKGWWRSTESDLISQNKIREKAPSLRRIVIISHPSREEQRSVMRRRLDSAGVAGYSFFDGVDCRSEPPCAAYLDGLHDFVSSQLNVSYQVEDDKRDEMLNWFSFG